MNFFRKIFATFTDSQEESRSYKVTHRKNPESETYDSCKAVVDGHHETRKSSSSQNPTESSHRVRKHPTSFWGTVFHIIFLSAGSPVLLLPSSFVLVGIVTGSATMLFIFVFYLYTTRMLIWSANEVCKLKLVSSVSYSDLMYEAFDLGPLLLRPFARIAQSLLSCIIILGWYGSCILLGLLMVDNLQTLCQSWLHTYLTIQNIVYIVFTPVLLLNLIRRLKFLEPCSTLGCILNIAAILLVLLYAATDSTPWKLKSSDNGSFEKVPQLVGVIFGNINITGMVMSLKNEMKHPNKFEAPCGALTIAYVIVFIMFFSMSLFFCMKYGTTVPENIIDIVPTSFVISLITSIMNVIGIYLLIPITLYVPLDLLWNDVLRGRAKSLRHKFVWEYVLRILLVILIFLVVYIDLDISFVLSFFGTVTSSLDSLVFPIIIHSLVVWKVNENSTKTILILIKNMIMLILGLMLTLAGIRTCIKDL